MVRKYATSVMLVLACTTAIPAAAATAPPSTPPTQTPTTTPTTTPTAAPLQSGDVVGNIQTYVVAGTNVSVTSQTPIAYHYATPSVELPQLDFNVVAQLVPSVDVANTAFLFQTSNFNGVIIKSQYTRTIPVTNATGVNTYAEALFGVSVPCLRTGAPSSQDYFPVTGNNQTLTILPSVDGTGYGVAFTDTSPHAAYQDYVNYVRGNGTPAAYLGTRTPTGAQFRSDLTSCSNQTATDPLVGNPQSLQFSLIDQALNPASLGQVDFDQPANLIGGEYAHTSLAGQDGNRVDLSYQRAFRIFPGSRTLLVVGVPVTFYDVQGRQAFRGTGTVGLQIPVTRNWTVQPQIGYGAVSAHALGETGQSVAGSITSQYALYNHWLGRGRLTLGNMVGYTQVTDVRLAGAPVSRHPGNFVTRDGFAYEYPLKTQFDGRGISVRASYTYTYVDGANLYLNQLHDLTLSLGVRTRETTLKNSYELIRVGLRGELGDKYNAVYVFGGYRF